MKNILIPIAFILFSTLLFANSNLKESISSKNNSIEHKIITNSNGEDTCYARICWNESETRRRCSDWVEVSCGAKLEIEKK